MINTYNKEENSKRCKKYYRENKKYRKKYLKKWYCKNKNDVLQHQRWYVIKSKFGITLDDYNRILENQHELCAICGKHSSTFSRNFAVDHCHVTDKIRGLLCLNCNTMLGKVNDDINILERAIAYLRQNK